MFPGRLKKPLLKLNRLVGHTSAKHHMTKPQIGDTAALDDEQHQKQLEGVYDQIAKKQHRAKENESLQVKSEEEARRAWEKEPLEIRSRYGSRECKELPPASTLEDLSGGMMEQTIRIVGRIHHVRSMSAKLAFVLIRQQVHTVQCVLEFCKSTVSEQFLRWATHLKPEGLVLVEGRIRQPPKPVEGCTIHDMEIFVERMYLLTPADDSLAVDVYGMDRVEENKDSHMFELVTPNRVRIANRIIFLRTPTMQSIFRINSGICSIFRSKLEALGFIEIHTPKLQPAATESGAEVFQVNYFGRRVFLAQSPQLAKQMAISADFGRVFEIGPVFRAEDSNTHRHLTEYTGLDLEMTIEKDYHEALDVIDELLKNIFRGIYDRFRKEFDIVKTRFPHDDLVWLDETPRLSYKEAIELLNSSGWTDDNGNPASPTEDLNTRAEIRLGELVKGKYNTDYYVIDKFPASVRPFYTQLDPADNKVTNSFDIFLRGQEIVTGGQRINDARALAARMKDAGVDPDDMQEYMEGFEWGAPPHAGCGIGLERVLFLLLNLGDIRNGSMFPRDPKSLPEKKEEKGVKLRHPEADTMRYPLMCEHGNTEMPTLEKLIANYGDATNTSWLDDRYQVWRDEQTGAAVGYAEDNGYALIMGNPLCDSRQYPSVIKAFLKYLRTEKDLRPLWLLVSTEIEELLGSKLAWRTLTCVAEERVAVDSAKKVAKKERQAERAGVKIHQLGLDESVPEDLRRRCDKRIEDWKASRTGKQVHMTEVRPWIDMEHRRYVWAEDSKGEIAGLIVLHQLAPSRGYQIKFALDFPGAPTGTIEALISHSIQSLAKSGVQTVTFGAGATPKLEVGSNLHGVRAKILLHTYKAIVEQLKLVQKSEFREKFGAKEDPVYICYPSMGLGVSGARTLIKFFEDEM